MVYLSRFYGLNEVADYWEQIVYMNDWQRKRIFKLVNSKLFGTLTNKKLAIFGFAFKANTNDTRESPSIDISKDLLIESAEIAVFDPKVDKSQIFKDLSSHSKDGNIHVCKNEFEAANESDAIIVLTEWHDFQITDWREIYSRMRKPAWIFDTRAYLDKKYLKK